ncbi:MAG TPA: GTPase [Gemmataceae bacterium]|nr:GTPase [Gemmataceae bacterium]
MSEAETHAACLTPPGISALAVLAVRGPRAWQVARSLFQPRSKSITLPDEPRPGQFWLGRFGVGAVDDVVLAIKAAHSTESPWVEIHCHGGREVVRLLMETLEAHGARTCSWQQLEHFTAGDPLHAAAIAALAEAKTVRTAAILLDQAHGAFRRAVESVLASVQAGNLASAEEQLAQLDRFSSIGRHLTTPWRVVAAGAPNVGKSSLANAIAGYQRCIVAPSPGTTRDVVTTLVAIDGWPVELADTAGMRAEAEALEAVGIRMAQDTAAAADLCLWVLDSSVPAKWPDSSLENMLLVVNKIDLPAAWDLQEAKNALHVSAFNSTGVAELCAAIANRLAPNPPPTGSAVPFTFELGDAIHKARECLRAGDLNRLAVALGATLEVPRRPEGDR